MVEAARGWPGQLQHMAPREEEVLGRGPAAWKGPRVRRQRLVDRTGTSLPDAVVQAQLKEMGVTFPGPVDDGVPTVQECLPAPPIPTEVLGSAAAAFKRRAGSARVHTEDGGEAGRISTRPLRDRLGVTHRQGHLGLCRMSSSVVFEEGYELSHDIEELVKTAMGRNRNRRYTDEKYRKAACTIQTYYRRYRLRQQFLQLRRGTSCSRSPAPKASDSCLDGLAPLTSHLVVPCAVQSAGSLLAAPPADEQHHTHTSDCDGSGDQHGGLPAAGESAGCDGTRCEGGKGCAVQYTAEEREWLWRLGIQKFNRQAVNGLAFLVGKGLLEPTPKATACFLLGAADSASHMSKAVVGEYLGEPSAFHVEVLNELVRQIDFMDMDFDRALRHYLSHFRLPGEAQKIDRMMECFAKHYYDVYEQQRQRLAGSEGKDKTPDFANSDTLYVLAYACIMLNTDAHNPNVKHKMTQKDFIRNTKGINAGGDLPRAYVVSLYDSIVSTQVMTTDPHTAAVKAICARLSGLPEAQEMAPPWRYFVAEIEVEQISSIVANPGGSHMRQLLLFNDVLVITKQRKGVGLVKHWVSLYGLSVLSVCSRTFKCAYQLHCGKQGQRLGAFAPLASDRDGRRTEAFFATLQDYVAEAEALEAARQAQVLATAAQRDMGHPQADRSKLSRDSQQCAAMDARRPVSMPTNGRKAGVLGWATTSCSAILTASNDWNGNDSTGGTGSKLSLAVRHSLRRKPVRRCERSRSRVVDMEKVLVPRQGPTGMANIENIPGMATCSSSAALGALEEDCQSPDGSHASSVLGGRWSGGLSMGSLSTVDFATPHCHEMEGGGCQVAAQLMQSASLPSPSWESWMLSNPLTNRVSATLRNAVRLFSSWKVQGRRRQGAKNRAASVDATVHTMQTLSAIVDSPVMRSRSQGRGSSSRGRLVSMDDLCLGQTQAASP